MVPDRSNCQLRNHASTEEILGIVTQYIDVTDDSQVLTHHGLDSITAVRLQTAIAAALGVRLPLVDFLGEATVQSLADSLNASEIPVAPEPARPEESDISVAEEVLSGPLTPTQAMYWVGRQSDYPLGVFTRHLAGLARLTAQPLANVPTLLAVAGQRSPANSGVGMGVDDAVDDEFLGWGSNLPEETTVVVVPGHHYTVLSEPGLSGISERLVEMLDTIESTMGDRK